MDRGRIKNIFVSPNKELWIEVYYISREGFYTDTLNYESNDDKCWIKRLQMS